MASFIDSNAFFTSLFHLNACFSLIRFTIYLVVSAKSRMNLLIKFTCPKKDMTAFPFDGRLNY